MTLTCWVRCVSTEGARQQARLFHDLCDEFFLAIGHDVHTCHTGQFAHLLDDLDANFLTLGALLMFRHPLEPLDDGIGNIDAGHLAAHELGGADRS